MKFQRFTAMILTAGILMSVCSGCRSSDSQGSALASLEEDSNWADLTPAETPEPTPSPSPTTYLPELAGDGDELGEDVTADYQAAFLGTWIDEQSIYYEFRSSGVLVITTEATGAAENWSYSFRMSGSIPLLVMTQSSTEKRYSFTLTSKNLTLYDPDSGNAQALLSKVTEEPQVSAPVQTEEPTPTPEATAAAQPTAQATAAPAVNEPEPTAQPEEEQEQPEEQPEQEPAENPEETQQVESNDLDEIVPDAVKVETEELPSQYKNANPVLENVMGAVLDIPGISFNKDDPKSFWGIVAHYLCAEGKATNIEGNYFTVSEQDVTDAAKIIFADFSQIPAPDGTYCTDHGDGTYTLTYGGADVREIVWYEVDGSYVIQIGGQDAYTVNVNDSGAVISVTEFTAEQAN